MLKYRDMDNVSSSGRKSADDYAAAIVETVRHPLLVLDAELRVKTASGSFYRDFKVTPDETIGRFVFELGNGQWNIPALRKLLDELLPTNGQFEDYRVEHDFPDIGHKIMMLNARRLQHDGRPDSILLAVEDVTEGITREAEANRLWLHTT